MALKGYLLHIFGDELPGCEFNGWAFEDLCYGCILANIALEEEYCLQ